MIVDEFIHRFDFLQRMTLDFVDAVPEQYWDYTPLPPAPGAANAPALRHGSGFAPLCKQVRHVVCVRGVYSEAIVTKRADFSRKHSHYSGALTKPALRDALVATRQQLAAALERVDTGQPIDFFGTKFSFTELTYTVVQHDGIHHGQWSVYAALAGFETPPSWRQEWGLSARTCSLPDGQR